MFRTNNDWEAILTDEFRQPYMFELEKFLQREYEQHTVYPDKEQLFEAFKLTPFAAVKAVIIGQDPYHQPGQAHGLSFSVNRGVTIPPSLRNMFRELQDDLGVDVPRHGDLRGWAEQGVLLLNAVLTVRANEPMSHRDCQWERFTDAVVRRLNERPEPIVFVLWGRAAQSKHRLIDSDRHPVISGAHPSPLAAHRGFFGSRPFSRINDRLAALGQAPIDWRLSTLDVD